MLSRADADDGEQLRARGRAGRRVGVMVAVDGVGAVGAVDAAGAAGDWAGALIVAGALVALVIAAAMVTLAPVVPLVAVVPLLLSTLLITARSWSAEGSVGWGGAGVGLLRLVGFAGGCEFGSDGAGALGLGGASHGSGPMKPSSSSWLACAARMRALKWVDWISMR